MNRFRNISLFLVATLVIVGSLAGYEIALAVKGEGSATIDGAGNTTVERAVSHTFTVVLTVGASGITVDAANPTFTIPTGFTAPNASPVATAGDVNADGKWSAIGGATCPVTMGSSGAGGQVMTVDVTTVCTVGPGGTITLTYKGTSAVTMGATALTIMTADDAGVPTPAIALTGGSPTITVTDTIAPTVTSITLSDSAIIIGDTSTVTVVMSEPVASFANTDVTTPNGTLGTLSTGDNITFTGTFTPNAIEDTTNIAVVATTFTDTAGNPASAGASSANYTIDTIAPTVTVTMSDAALTFGETALVTFTFSEAPTGFTTLDVTVANGSIGAIDAGNPLIQTATYTPTNAITDATNVITVGTAWTDTALNVGGTDDSPNYTIDTTTPTPGGGGNSGGGGSFAIPPLINVTKIPSPLALPGGAGSVTYTYTATNIGPVAMSGAWVKDDKCSPVTFISGDSNNNSALDINEAWVYRCTKTVSQTETNTATAHGSANGWSAYDTANATVVVGVALPPPLIHLVKVPSVFVLPAGGGAVTYRYTVTNPGTVALSNVSVTDDKCTGLPGRVIGHPGDLNKNNLLESNETWSFTCQTNLTQTTTNIGTAEGHANGLTAIDFSPATVVVATPGLPNTGMSQGLGDALKSIAIVAGMFVLAFLGLILRKKTV